MAKFCDIAGSIMTMQTFCLSAVLIASAVCTADRFTNGKSWRRPRYRHERYKGRAVVSVENIKNRKTSLISSLSPVLAVLLVLVILVVVILCMIFGGGSWKTPINNVMDVLNSDSKEHETYASLL